MGTSSSYGGPKNNTPLVPSWLDGSNTQETPETPDVNISDNSQSGDDSENKVLPPIPSVPSGQRFRGSRTNFTKYLNSQGRDSSSLRNSFKGYVGSSLGGSRKAATRIGTSKKVAGQIVGLISSIQNNGYEATLISYNLAEYRGKPIKETFVKLVEIVCLQDIVGSNIDEAIARRATIETLNELSIEKVDINTIEKDPSFLTHILNIFITKSIRNRLLEDIGQNIIISAKNRANIKSIEANLDAFIKIRVTKSIAKTLGNKLSINNTQISKTISNVYSRAYKFLEQFGE